MKLIVGLGNPGGSYEGTRHNLGFDVIDELARRWNVRLKSWKSSQAGVGTSGDRGVILAKPRTFVNLSGQAVGDIVAYHRIDLPDVLVIVDEINLPLARLRVRRSGSAGGHNGLKSVIECLGTGFPRLRIGVGRGDPQRDLADHVLSRFSADEREAVDRAVARAADAVEIFVAEGIEPVMNRFNAAPDDKKDEKNENDEKDEARQPEAPRTEPKTQNS